jgi:hypothetical protein
MSEVPIEITRGQGINPDVFERDTYTQFQTWLGETKSTEGCPVNCTYCFFKLDGQTPKRPDINMSPQETIDALGQAPTYQPEIPINFGSQTDAFSTPKVIAHYKEVLQRYGESDYPNPVVFITKRKIPEDFMVLAKETKQPVVFYMSYSGLAGTGLEPTVKKEHIRENFLRLEEYDLPRVHYWRPFMPQNSAPEKISGMLDFVAEHADCSVINGLKLNDGILEHVAPFWPELKQQDYDFQQSGDFWPQGVRSFLQSYARENHPDYPLFFDTACSLSYVLQKPDIQGAYRGEMCADSSCPTSQRDRCAQGFVLPSDLVVHEAAQSIGIPPEAVQISDGRVVVDSEVATGGLVYLRAKLRLPIVSRGVDYKGHNWASSIDAENSIVEVPWSNNNL